MLEASKSLDWRALPGVIKNNRGSPFGHPDYVWGESNRQLESVCRRVGETMGMKFRFRRTKCTGRYRDKPLVEVRWTTEEGDYCLEDLIAGDLSDELTARQLMGGNGNGDEKNNSLPQAPFPKAPVMHRTVVNVDLTVPPNENNASAIRQVATSPKPALGTDPETPPGILNKII